MRLVSWIFTFALVISLPLIYFGNKYDDRIRSRLLDLKASLSAPRANPQDMYRSTADLGEVKQRVLPLLKQSVLSDGYEFGAPLFVRIFKQSHELEIWLQKADGTYGLYKNYPICRYSGSLGPKLKEGDRQAPEGFYSVSTREMLPTSTNHLAFNIGFPNAYDRAHKRTGSYLMVHGKCTSIGCFAMTDKGIEEIYLLAEAALNQGQNRFQVHIFPFRFDHDRARQAGNQEWKAFWKNLEEGYRLFEETNIPPKVSVANNVYQFSKQATAFLN